MGIKRGDIWYVESGYTTGSEQRPGRPAIVVSNDLNNYHSSTVEVIYLTTQPKHDLPTHVNIHSLSRESIAICEQITTVAVERMGNYRGRVTEAEMHDIEVAMMVSLGLTQQENEAEEPVSDETPPHARNTPRRSGSPVLDPSADVRHTAQQNAQTELNEKGGRPGVSGLPPLRLSEIFSGKLFRKTLTNTT